MANLEIVASRMFRDYSNTAGKALADKAPERFENCEYGVSSVKGTTVRFLNVAAWRNFHPTPSSMELTNPKIKRDFKIFHS
jgi:hypothetical protein